MVNIIKQEVVSKYDSSIKDRMDNVYFEDLIEDNIVIIATGPLTSEKLSEKIAKITGSDKLFFYDDLSQTQISGILNISQMQVSRRLKKAQKQLLEFLAPNYKDEITLKESLIKDE